MSDPLIAIRLQIGAIVEHCRVAPYNGPNYYPEAMVRVLPMSRASAHLAKLVLPARVLSGSPVNYNRVTYTRIT